VAKKKKINSHVLLDCCRVIVVDEIFKIPADERFHFVQ